MTYQCEFCDNKMPAIEEERKSPEDLRPSDELRVSLNNKELLRINLNQQPNSISYTAGDYQIKLTRIKSGNGKFESKEETILRRNYQYIVEELCYKCSPIVIRLYQEGIFSQLDKYDIEDQPTRRQKIELLLEKVLDKCPTSWPIFIKAIEHEHEYVARKLHICHTHLDRANGALFDELKQFLAPHTKIIEPFLKF